MKAFRNFFTGVMPQRGVSVHPKKDENGKPVHLEEPDDSSYVDHWDNPDKIAKVAAGHHFDHDKFSSWSGHDGDWNEVSGQGDFEEPPLPKDGRRLATGAIVHEPDGRVWVVHPSNAFGGYKTTFPKGKVDSGINPRANAIKEVFEESGLKIKLTGHAADSERSTSFARYYHAERVGGHPKDMGWESQAVSLVPKRHLRDYLNHPNDKKVVDDIDF